jgi:hypothetical protein
VSAGVCNVCRADISWAITRPGNKRMPLDPPRYEGTDERANVAVSRDHHGSLLARVLKNGEQPESYEWRAMPHFATCKALTLNRQAQRGELAADGVLPFRRRHA